VLGQLSHWICNRFNQLRLRADGPATRRTHLDSGHGSGCRPFFLRSTRSLRNEMLASCLRAQGVLIGLCGMEGPLR
jgi:hypothetical protein